jgi:FdhD protein
MTAFEQEIAATLPAASVIARGKLAGVSTLWHVAEEIPVAIMLNSEPLAVMMATPYQLDDFAIGFALAEGFLASAAAVRGVLTLPAEGGITVDVSADETAVLPRAAPLRGIEGRSGCGLCGVAEIGAVLRPLPRIAEPIMLTSDAVRRAFRALPAHQPMNRVNRSVHAAAWCDEDGAILLAREDVGRHSALDKLIGALACDGGSFGKGFIVLSSRLSFELVQKAATVGIGAIAAISAPTALALSVAAGSGITLAIGSGDNVMLFDPEG